MLNDYHNKINSYEIHESLGDELEYDEELLGTDIRKLYSKDIDMYPLLTNEEEKKIINILCNSSKDSIEYKNAKELLINSNLRLVIYISKKYQNRGLSLMDLIQEGTIGLITAVDKFDDSKETRFSTYGAYWIIQKIKRALCEKTRNIRIPNRTFLELNSYFKNVEKLAKRLNREPTYNEITNYLGYKKSEIDRYEKLSYDTVSLNKIINEYEFEELESFVEYSNDDIENKVINECIKEEIVYALINNLDKRAAYVIIKRYGLDGENPKTLEEIGRAIGKTYERVRQIEKSTIQRIRKSEYLSSIFASFTDCPEKALENVSKICYIKRSYNKRKNYKESSNETYRINNDEMFNMNNEKIKVLKSINK